MPLWFRSTNLTCLILPPKTLTETPKATTIHFRLQFMENTCTHTLSLSSLTGTNWWKVMLVCWYWLSGATTEWTKFASWICLGGGEQLLQETTSPLHIYQIVLPLSTIYQFILKDGLSQCFAGSYDQARPACSASQPQGTPLLHQILSNLTIVAL